MLSSISLILVYFALIVVLARNYRPTHTLSHDTTYCSISITNDSADGWPLTKPLQCVSLRVERRGDVLLLIFTFTHGDVGARGQQKLFALCPIDIVNQTDNEKKKVDHFVEAVLDSTRYFVVRVKDEKADREALIGLGFRDREEAGDFRAALAKYEQDIKKEYANR